MPHTNTQNTWKHQRERGYQKEGEKKTKKKASETKIGKGFQECERLRLYLKSAKIIYVKLVNTNDQKYVTLILSEV